MGIIASFPSLKGGEAKCDEGRGKAHHRPKPRAGRAKKAPAAPGASCPGGGGDGDGCELLVVVVMVVVVQSAPEQDDTS